MAEKTEVLTALRIMVDTTEMDAALEKAERLRATLIEIKALQASLCAERVPLTLNLPAWNVAIDDETKARWGELVKDILAQSDRHSGEARG